MYLCSFEQISSTQTQWRSYVMVFFPYGQLSGNISTVCYCFLTNNTRCMCHLAVVKQRQQKKSPESHFASNIHTCILPGFTCYCNAMAGSTSITTAAGWVETQISKAIYVLESIHVAQKPTLKVGFYRHIRYWSSFKLH